MFTACYPSWLLKPFGRTGNVWLVKPVQVWAYFSNIPVGMLQLYADKLVHNCTVFTVCVPFCVWHMYFDH